MPIFVSAQYVVNELPPPDQTIHAEDEEGTVWTIPPDCQQGDWLRFIEAGGTIKQPTSTEQQS